VTLTEAGPALGGHASRRVTLAVFAAMTATIQPPFLFGSLADEINLGGGEAFNRILVSAFFVATAGGALAPRLQAGMSPRALIGVAPLLGAGALSILALRPEPVVAVVGLALAGLLNGAVTRAAIAIVNDLSPRAATGGLAQLTVATASGPLFVGLVVGLAGAAGIGARATVATHAGLVACGAIATLRAAPHLPRAPASACGRTPAPSGRAARAPDGWTLITVCVFVAAISSYIVAIFFVPFVRDAGMGVTAAGLELLVTSVVAVATRLLISRHPELIARRSRHTSTLILAGAAGTALLAAGSPPLVALAMPLIGTGAWGWIGLLMSASRHAPDPVAAGSAIQGSNFAAAAAGPLVAGTGVAVIGSAPLLLALTAAAALSGVALWRPLARLDDARG
jgi:hypothetical protein